MQDQKDELALQISQIVQALKEGTTIQQYLEARQQMKEDAEAQVHIENFQCAKELFANVEAYGKWAPDYEEKRLQLSEAKSRMDDHAAVKAFKSAERNLEILLDDLTERIFSSVMEEIPIAYQSGFRFAKRVQGCGCQSGKIGCKCKD